MHVKADLTSSRSHAENPEPQLLTIGEIATRTGKRASSIRYYESIGVLPQPKRVSGRRRYPAEIVRTLAVVDTAQRSGMSLDEIKLLLEASPEDDSALERLRQLAERKLPEIQTLIEQTQMVRRWLETAAACQCPSLDDCPLFDEQPCLTPRPARATRTAPSRYR
jgi:MerR family transcriptional regulator, redox-sensitive transcriptional activator SoxR